MAIVPRVGRPHRLATRRRCPRGSFVVHRAVDGGVVGKRRRHHWLKAHRDTKNATMRSSHKSAARMRIRLSRPGRGRDLIRSASIARTTSTYSGVKARLGMTCGIVSVAWTTKSSLASAKRWMPDQWINSVPAPQKNGHRQKQPQPPPCPLHAAGDLALLQHGGTGDDNVVGNHALPISRPPSVPTAGVAPSLRRPRFNDSRATGFAQFAHHHRREAPHQFR